MTTSGDPSIDRYVTAVGAVVETAHGRPVSGGTVVVGPADRVGSIAAVGYFLPAATAVMCAPERVEHHRDLGDDAVLSPDDFIARAESLGGTFVGAGLNHVFPQGGEPSGEVPPDVTARDLHPGSSDDRALVRALLDQCPEDDVEEAEIDPDELDPRIVVLVDASGAAVAFASGYAWDYASDFDDVGVLVHPDARGRGLGRAVVAEYVRRHGERRSFLYRHDVDNVGSAALCRSVGFVEVHRLVAVTLP